MYLKELTWGLVAYSLSYIYLGCLDNWSQLRDRPRSGPPALSEGLSPHLVLKKRGGAEWSETGTHTICKCKSNPPALQLRGVKNGQSDNMCATFHSCQVSPSPWCYPSICQIWIPFLAKRRKHLKSSARLTSWWTMAAFPTEAVSSTPASRRTRRSWTSITSGRCSWRNVRAEKIRI